MQICEAMKHAGESRQSRGYTSPPFPSCGGSVGGWGGAETGWEKHHECKEARGSEDGRRASEEEENSQRVKLI